MGNHIVKVVQRLVSQSQSAGGASSHQIIVRNVAENEEGLSISDCGDTITIATPESLTEQVAMTLASAISDGRLLARAGTAEGTVTMVTTEETLEEGVQVVQQQEEYVITSPDEVEFQTVVVWSKRMLTTDCCGFDYDFVASNCTVYLHFKWKKPKLRPKCFWFMRYTSVPQDYCFITQLIFVGRSTNIILFIKCFV